ncbi:MAG: MBL fold metallo-hydrolase [Clostridia bacterium]|nr:MBL fold metallo-hydrolase [Clostridia bacterium]
MKITYLGHACFLIEGEQKSVITDPFKDIGYDLERATADYCTVSHGHFDHDNVDGVNVAHVVRGAEKGFLAIRTYHDANLGALRGENTVFKFEIDGVTFCHMGDIGEYFCQDLVEEIGKVDVLFIPVGGKYTIDCKEAVKYATAISAKITIPMHYKTPKSQIDVSDERGFTKKMLGVERVAKSVEIDGYLQGEDDVTLVFDTSAF